MGRDCDGILFYGVAVELSEFPDDDIDTWLEENREHLDIECTHLGYDSGVVALYPKGFCYKASWDEIVKVNTNRQHYMFDLWCTSNDFRYPRWYLSSSYR